MTLEDERLITRAARAYEGRANETILIETRIVEVFDLIGMVQLALRMPGVKKNPAAARAEKFCVDLIERIDPDHGDIWRLLNMGFNPVHDQKSGNS